MESDNPSPFKQPFLVLHLSPKQDCNEWTIDVDGKIDLYLNNFKNITGSGTDRSKDATQLMKEVARQLKARGVLVYRISMYKGSGGPSHILRNGGVFQRIGFTGKDGGELPTWMDEKSHDNRIK